MMKHTKIYLLFSVLILWGCVTKRVETAYKVVEVHDTLRMEVERADSIFVRDSVRIWMKGDTIFRDRWRTEYRDRWRDKVRYVVRERADTIVQTKVIYQKERLTLWERMKTRLTELCCFLVIALLLGFSLYWYLKNGRRGA